jgi:hypothetical protein
MFAEFFILTLECVQKPVFVVETKFVSMIKQNSGDSSLKSWMENIRPAYTLRLLVFDVNVTEK